METRAQKKQRLIRLIHVAKTQLMMDDGEYRALLACRTGDEDAGFCGYHKSTGGIK